MSPDLFRFLSFSFPFIFFFFVVSFSPFSSEDIEAVGPAEQIFESKVGGGEGVMRKRIKARAIYGISGTFKFSGKM